MIFERLRQHGVLRRSVGLVEILLHGLVHPHSVFDQLILVLFKLADARLFLAKLVDEEHLVLLVLALVPHQIHLLDPHAPIRVLHILHSLLVESCLSICHILTAVLDLLPSFFE